MEFNLKIEAEPVATRKIHATECTQTYQFSRKTKLQLNMCINIFILFTKEIYSPF